MRTFILTTTCAALVSLSAVSPAVAEQRPRDVLVPLLLGGLAIYAIKERKDRKRQQAPATPAPAQVDRKVLPAACYTRVNTWDGRVGLFGGRCLQRQYAHVDHLPRQCRTRIENAQGKVRRGYAARCLRHFGYRMSSR